MKQLMKIFMLTVVLALLGMPVFAQRQMPLPDDRQEEEGQFAPDQGRGGPPSGERREEIRRKIEAIRIWRLTEELKLDEKTAARFFPVLSSLTQRRHELLRENIETERELRIFLEAGRPDERKIKAALEKMEKIHHDMKRLTEKERDATKDYLTVEQQARYYLFQQDFQREMREMISGARGGGQGQRRGPGMQEGQDQRDMRGMGGNQRPRGDMQPRMRR